MVGSSVEFYILPAIPCFGDKDIMWPSQNALALPREYYFCDLEPHITHSVHRFFLKNDVERLLIIPDEWNCQGYVRLARCHPSRRENENGRDISIKCLVDNNLEMPKTLNNKSRERNGPAWKKLNLYKQNIFSIMSWYTVITEIDNLLYVYCPIWPDVAKRWVSRQRHTGWPDQTVLKLCVSKGCDIVASTHPDHRPNTKQFRYSFSRVEVILLNSWTPTLQLLYHMLRFITKNDPVLQSEDDKPLLCRYHLKTLMLWACERKSPDWWNSANLVNICSQLLDILANMVLNGKIQNYFIPKCNLLGHNMDGIKRQATVRRLK